MTEPFVNQIVCADCVSFMASLPPESIPLVVTSPPYDSLRTYKGFAFDVAGVIAGLWRVVSSGGVVVWVVGDATVGMSETGTSFRQALAFKEAGFLLYDTMIYQKTNPIPLNKRRYNSCFEYMFVFSKGSPRVWNPIVEPCKLAGRVNSGTHRTEGGTLIPKTGCGRPIKAEKIKGNIWSYSVGSTSTATDSLWKEHPAVFPLQLAKDHVTSWSEPGDVVFDPFCGSGQTCLAAASLGRRWLGCDCSEEYVALAKRRMAAVGTA